MFLSMDFFSHGALSYILFYRRKDVWFAVLFGLLADIISWAPFFFYRLFNGGVGRPSSILPSWVQASYGLGHSLVVIAVIFLFVYLYLRRIPIFMFAWPIQVFLDMLTHTREFLPTPFLWPVSEWAFPGISWGTKWFMITNWGLIGISLILILVWRYKKK